MELLSLGTGRFARVRTAALLLVLLSVVLWGLREQARRRGRTRWDHTVAVDVVLLRHGPVPAITVDGLRRSVPRLQGALAAELSRYRPAAPAPFAFTVHGPVPIAQPPPDPPEQQDLLSRAGHYLKLRRYLAQVSERGHLSLDDQSIRLYLVLDPVRSRVRFVEGFGASGGDLGVVHAVVDDSTVDQVLLGLGHELLHCLGATDKYDEAGHAKGPGGLAEPHRSPPYPQRYAEIMVGEVPLASDRGRLIHSLDEVRVGLATASEIGWGPGR